MDLRLGSCEEILAGLEADSIDSVVTDPPYGLKFMGKKWDYDIPSVDTWREILRVLKPGGHLLAFGGTRTYHRMASRVEDVGFEIRDQLQWLFGQGFPKSLNISKAIDKAAGAEREIIGSEKRSASRASSQGASNGGEQGGYNLKAESTITAPATDAAKQWDGWGTSLKPASEPILLARKPLSEKTVAANVQNWGTGGVNVDASRIPGITEGRFPSNLLLEEEAAGMLGEPSRFFYVAKASTRERNAGLDTEPKKVNDGRNTPIDNPFQRGETLRKNTHPTVKPLRLMEYLVRLITPPGGIVLDPFMGSGTTGIAAKNLGFHFIGIEKDESYFEIARARCQ